MHQGGWADQAGAACADLASAALLCWAAGRHAQWRHRGNSMGKAYLCCAAAALLAGCGRAAASVQNLLLLGALAAALTPGGSLLSALLLAAGTADWLHGAVLLAVPLAVLGARRLDGGSISSSSSESTAAPAASASATRFLKALAVYSSCLIACGSALPQLAHLLLGPTRGRQLDHWLGLSSWQALLPLPLLPGQQHGQQAAPPSWHWVGTRSSQQPLHQQAALLLPAASLQPGLGLHWYLMAQAFPRFRSFFLYCLHVMPTATMLPLALRFPGRPELLLATGALLRCLLHPQPSAGSVALCVGLLPMAHQQLVSVVGLPWVALGTAAALLLSASAMELWLGSGGGNANFLYGMNLLWAGLQVLLLLQLLRIAARQELRAPVQSEPTGGGGGGSTEVPDPAAKPQIEH